MAVVFSKSFGPTSTTDDTVTTIGSTYQFPANYALSIEEIRISYAQATNANEAAGLIIIDIKGVIGNPFIYAFGNGAGGATNSNNSSAEKIRPTNPIPVPPNTTVTVKVISAEQLTDVIVSLSCGLGSGKHPMTLFAGGAGQDTTADTSLALTANAKVTALGGVGLVPFRDSVIRKIRFASSGVVDAKAQTAIITLTVSGYPFPLEFAMGKGSGGAATSSISDADEINGLAIPIKANSTIGVNVLSSEITLSATVSLECD